MKKHELETASAFYCVCVCLCVCVCVCVCVYKHRPFSTSDYAEYSGSQSLTPTNQASQDPIPSLKPNLMRCNQTCNDGAGNNCDYCLNLFLCMTSLPGFRLVPLIFVFDPLPEFCLEFVYSLIFLFAGIEL